MEDDFFNSQSPGIGIPTETLDSALAFQPIHQCYENNNNNLSHLNDVQTGIDHVADPNPDDTSNLDESALRHFPLNHNLCHVDELHVVNCQEKLEHPNVPSSSVVEIESLQRSSPIKSALGRNVQNKKGRPQFSEAVKSILRSFYSKNPYPEKNDVSDLACRAKLTPKQIRDWFSNKRNRKKKNREEPPGKPCNPLNTKLSLIPINADIAVFSASATKSPSPKLTRSSLDSLDRTFEQSGRNSQGPVSIDRYLASALEDDAVAFNVIEQAARNSQSPDTDYRSLKVRKISRASSVHSGKSSVGTTVSAVTIGTCASGQSSRSFRTTASVRSSVSRVSRRGRRKLVAPTRRLSPRRHKTGQKFFCTFCCDEFFGKYEWRRHEETVHVPQKVWVCKCAQLSVQDLCQYDLLLSPTDDHLVQHNHFSCIGKPEAERTFFRKDKLIQHLRQTHRMTESALTRLKHEGILDTWETELGPLSRDDPALHCGFCGLRLQNWDVRVEHVYDHFLEGKSPVDWWPTRLWHIQLTGKKPLFR